MRLALPVAILQPAPNLGFVKLLLLLLLWAAVEVKVSLAGRRSALSPASTAVQELLIGREEVETHLRGQILLLGHA